MFKIRCLFHMSFSLNNIILDIICPLDPFCGVIILSLLLLISVARGWGRATSGRFFFAVQLYTFNSHRFSSWEHWVPSFWSPKKCQQSQRMILSEERLQDLIKIGKQIAIGKDSDLSCYFLGAEFGQWTLIYFFSPAMLFFNCLNASKLKYYRISLSVAHFQLNFFFGRGMSFWST